MTATTERYEVFEDDDAYIPDDEQPKRSIKRRRVRAYMVTRCPYCHSPIKVYDDELPDAKIEEFIARGGCKWLEEHDPHKSHEIRSAFYARVNGEEKFSGKRGKRGRK